MAEAQQNPPKQIESENEDDESQTFENLGLDGRLIRALNKKKILNPTPIQRVAIPLILVKYSSLTLLPYFDWQWKSFSTVFLFLYRRKVRMWWPEPRLVLERPSLTCSLCFRSSFLLRKSRRRNSLPGPLFSSQLGNSLSRFVISIHFRVPFCLYCFFKLGVCFTGLQGGQVFDWAVSSSVESRAVDKQHAYFWFGWLFPFVFPCHRYSSGICLNICYTDSFYCSAQLSPGCLRFWSRLQLA